MQAFGISEVVNSLISNRALVYQLTRRNIQIRFRGAALGILWSLVTPILMLAMYTFVFGIILKVRWIQQQGGNLEFATILFSGLIVHTYFSECLQHSVDLITSNRQYVKKVIFPLTSLAWVAVLTSLFQATISTAVLLLYLAFAQNTLHWTLIVVPFLLLPLMLIALGVSWIISATGVYLRDISQMISLIVLALLFVSPVFYPVSSLPEALQPLLYLNPITWVIEQVRGAILWGEWPDLVGYIKYSVIAFLVAWLGVVWFQRLRPGFADVV
jgi:lipopolysaccharide transport system permease protein